jgi:hypothetical protein
LKKQEEIAQKHQADFISIIKASTENDKFENDEQEEPSKAVSNY